MLKRVAMKDKGIKTIAMYVRRRTSLASDTERCEFMSWTRDVMMGFSDSRALALRNDQLVSVSVAIRGPKLVG